MPAETWTVLQLLKWTADYFLSHHIDSPRPAAEVLLAHVLGFNRVDLYLQYDRPLNPRELAAFKDVIKRRLQREPVAYIVGERGFWSLDLHVTPHVLIPRPETERLVETALDVLPTGVDLPQRVLDMGTGSGAIVLALATERPGHRFYALDCSYEALEVARDNARKYGLETAVYFLCSDWFQGIADGDPGFDLIVSNPPYVSRHEWAELAPEVTQYEPPKALDGGVKGLDQIRTLIYDASKYLRPAGWLIFEIGCHQWADVKNLLEETDKYQDVEVVKDYNGRNRVVRAKVKTPARRPRL